jgi:hypothetical protein
MMPLGINGLERPSTALIFTNFRIDQQHNVTLSCIKTSPSQSRNMETMGVSLTDLGNYGTVLHITHNFATA